MACDSARCDTSLMPPCARLNLSVHSKMGNFFMKFAAALVSFLPLLAADYATYIGDQNSYTVSAITTDAVGNTYITGWRLLDPAQSTSSIWPRPARPTSS